MLQYHPSNPFRIPEWRWELARTLREQKSSALAKKTDKTILRAIKFQHKLAKCTDDISHWLLMEEFPSLYAAYLIHRNGQSEDKHPMRYAIEARLLAGQGPSEIAALLGTDPETIDLYEKLFFNIRDRLQHTDFIMTCIIGPSVQAGLSDRDYDLLWKLFGYLYGAHVLDAFINTTSRKYKPESLSEVDTALADDTRASIQRKVAIVARTFSVNPFSQSELLNIYARFLEVEKDANNGKGQDFILQNIQFMMDKLPWSVGKPKEMVQLPQHDNATELRTEELLQAAVGGNVDKIQDEDGLKFPSEEANAKSAAK